MTGGGGRRRGEWRLRRARRSASADYREWGGVCRGGEGGEREGEEEKNSKKERWKEREGANERERASERETNEEINTRKPLPSEEGTTKHDLRMLGQLRRAKRNLARTFFFLESFYRRERSTEKEKNKVVRRCRANMAHVRVKARSLPSFAGKGSHNLWSYFLFADREPFLNLWIRIINSRRPERARDEGITGLSEAD
jgi:hypothetical protein